MGARDSAAEQRLREASRRLVEGVERLGAAWMLSEAMRVVDAWGRFDPEERTRLEARLAIAARTAAGRVVSELVDLFALDVREQRTTPLAVIRTIVREPTGELEQSGIPAVERDPFEVRTLPGDLYGLAPKDLAVLGDPDLAAVHVIWGVAKAEVLRESPDVRDDFTEP